MLVELYAYKMDGYTVGSVFVSVVTAEELLHSGIYRFIGELGCVVGERGCGCVVGGLCAGCVGELMCVGELGCGCAGGFEFKYPYTLWKFDCDIYASLICAVFRYKVDI